MKETRVKFSYLDTLYNWIPLNLNAFFLIDIDIVTQLRKLQFTVWSVTELGECLETQTQQLQEMDFEKCWDFQVQEA